MQLVWPSELKTPAQVDWAISDTNNLLTCQYDDGTTVTNAISGATGEVFDTANQIGVTAPNGERLSATWSTGKPSNIDKNPFSLLETIYQDDEFCLKVAANSTLHVTGLVGNATFKVYLANDFPPFPSPYGYLFDARADSGTGYMYVFGAGGYNSNSVTNVKKNGVSVNFNTFGAAVKGDILEWQNSTHNGSVDFFGRYNNAESMIDFQCDRIDIIDDNGLHVFVLDQTTGDVVQSVTSNLVLTLVGYPADFGFKQVANEITGFTLALSSHIIQFPLVGAWTGTITYEDGSTSAVSGTDAYQINGTTPVVFKSFDVTDTNGAHFYDATLLDNDNIIDTALSNHATFSGASTVKWQPVINTDVFTLGTGHDYVTLGDYMTAWDSVVKTTHHKVLVDYDLSAFWSPSNHEGNNWPYGLTFEAMRPFDINDPNSLATCSRIDIAKYSWNRMCVTNPLTFKGLFIRHTSTYGITTTFTNGNPRCIQLFDNFIEQVGYYNPSRQTLSTYLAVYGDVAHKAKRNIFKGNNGGQFVIYNSTAGIDGSVITDNIILPSGNPRDDGGINVTTTGAINNLTIANNLIMYGNGTKPDMVLTSANLVAGMVTNNVTVDGTGDISGATTAWFENYASGDYRINTTGQASLAGNGWNDSDIVGAFYVTEIPAPFKTYWALCSNSTLIYF